MPKVADPEVVFCEYNHIYDKSLNDSCPYCKQIAEKTNQMKRQINDPPQKVGGKIWDFLRSRRGNDNDATVLRRDLTADDDDPTVLSSAAVADDDDATVLSSAAAAAEDDDATEMFAGNAVPGEDEDRTEYRPNLRMDTADQQVSQQPDPVISFGFAGNDAAAIRINVHVTEEAENSPAALNSFVVKDEPAPAMIVSEPVEAAAAQVRKKVIGWLICADGEPNYGTSVELKEGINGIVFDDNGVVRIEDAEKSENCTMVIYRDRMTGIFRIRPENGTQVIVNERTLTCGSNLEPYSCIRVQACSLVFFPAVGVCGFEWRQ